ncbi:uncharacterized protein LOC127414108 [Myxocyprinus asiaticus]|uniref:uncharacterized protein LOC127414108 n=1 Tax=Myxocyprinus asiaticus TaxID=70543 RepID=UPI002222BCCB|nr:uncharacterized protein LOC127414108 [Myxocyprinus asiaticus]
MQILWSACCLIKQRTLNFYVMCHSHSGEFVELCDIGSGKLEDKDSVPLAHGISVSMGTLIVSMGTRIMPTFSCRSCCVFSVLVASLRIVVTFLLVALLALTLHLSIPHRLSLYTGSVLHTTTMHTNLRTHYPPEDFSWISSSHYHDAHKPTNTLSSRGFIADQRSTLPQHTQAYEHTLHFHAAVGAGFPSRIASSAVFDI